MSRAVLATALVLVGVCACEPPKPRHPMAARFCVVVTALEPDAEALNRLMDPFALNHDLKIAVSPTTHTYEDAERTTMINVDRMGNLGAVITLYGLQDQASAFEAPLQAHVEDKVAKRWTVRQCEDVDGFKGPWLYR